MPDRTWSCVPATLTITLPPSTEERITFAPTEMSSSPAPSRNASPAASITTSAESSAMFVKLPELKNTWPDEIAPKSRIRAGR